MDITKRLKGYQRLGRERHFIARDAKLSDSEYRLWDLIGACMIWDDAKETFRTLEATQTLLATLLGWSVSKVSRKLHLLYEKGFISIIAEGIYEGHFLPDLQLMSAKGVVGDADLQREKPEVQNQIASEREDIAKVQKVWPRSENTTLGAYKVNSGSLDRDSTNAEFNETDRDWISRNVK